jgi:dephospho-CoA kinase
MIHVGLTGNIASGKSTVAARLAAHGAVVLDADAYAREAVAPGSPALEAVAERFGSGVIRPDGTLDRAALGKLVFRDARARADLEAIVHPEVARRRAADLAAARDGGAAVVVSDVPLLFEAGLEDEFDLIVFVDAPEEERLRRLVVERGLTADDARAMVAAQSDPVVKRARADIVIDNDGTMEALARRVDALWAELSARANARP